MVAPSNEPVHMHTFSEVNNEKAAASNQAHSPEAGAPESVRCNGGFRSRKANAILSSKSKAVARS